MRFSFQNRDIMFFNTIFNWKASHCLHTGVDVFWLLLIKLQGRCISYSRKSKINSC